MEQTKQTILSRKCYHILSISDHKLNKTLLYTIFSWIKYKQWLTKLSKNLRFVNILSVHSVVYLHSVLLRVINMRPWGYTLSCSYQPCATSVTLSSPGNGYLWQSPSKLWARMPKLSWVTVSPGLSPLFMYLLLAALRHKSIMLFIRSIIFGEWRIIFGAGRGLFWRFRMAATRCCS